MNIQCNNLLTKKSRLLSQQRKRNLMTKVKHDIFSQTVCVFHVKLKTVRYTMKTESIEEEHAYVVG